jgi:anti-anti-sigma factor
MAVGNSSGGDALFIGADDRGVFLRALGHVRAMLCYPLRNSLLAGLEDAGPLPAVFVDLSGCQYMDSTFIGMLVAIDKKLRKVSGERLRIVRPSPACMELLSQIGLQDYLAIDTAALALPAAMEEVSATDRPGADFILKAHEALMETSEEARKKFALLKEVLEKKLRAVKPRPDNPEG